MGTASFSNYWSDKRTLRCARCRTPIDCTHCADIADNTDQKIYAHFHFARDDEDITLTFSLSGTLKPTGSEPAFGTTFQYHLKKGEALVKMIGIDGSSDHWCVGCLVDQDLSLLKTLAVNCYGKAKLIGFRRDSYQPLW